MSRQAAGLPGCACGQPSRRNRWCWTQAKVTGTCQIFFHGPPYCCWTGLPSPARQSGQYRMLVLNSQPSSTTGGSGPVRDLAMGG